jgi:hypothetical protein
MTETIRLWVLSASIGNVSGGDLSSKTHMTETIRLWVLSASIGNVSEGDLSSKTQNRIFHTLFCNERFQMS